MSKSVPTLNIDILEQLGSQASLAAGMKFATVHSGSITVVVCDTDGDYPSIKYGLDNPERASATWRVRQVTTAIAAMAVVKPPTDKEVAAVVAEFKAWSVGDQALMALQMARRLDKRKLGAAIEALGNLGFPSTVIL